MTFEESLQDVAIRERQLETHLLSSREYLRRADQEIKRQVSMLYLAIALLILVQGIYAFQNPRGMPFGETMLITVTSFLAIITCFLLIQSKNCLSRLNEAWLNPQERIALDTLKIQRHEILTRVPHREAPPKSVDQN